MAPSEEDLPGCLPMVILISRYQQNLDLDLLGDSENDISSLTRLAF